MTQNHLKNPLIWQYSNIMVAILFPVIRQAKPNMKNMF